MGALLGRRRENFAPRRFWFGFRFGCFLDFFLAFVFVSHEEKFATKAPAEKGRGAS